MSARRFVERAPGAPRPIGSPHWHGWPNAGDVVRAALAAAVCVALTLVGDQDLSDVPRNLDAFGVVLIAAVCAPVAFRRANPLAAAVASLALTFAGTAIGYEMTAATLVALGLVGRATSRAEVRLTGTLGVFSGVVISVCALIGARADPALVLVGGFAIGMLPALIGEKLRAERVRTRDARELARRVEELRDREVQRAVAEERLRIARDVHDITGHHLSAIALQAAGAGRTTPDPGARDVFDRIHGLTTEALGQTRRALGVLRQVSDPAALAPSPRLAHVEHLLGPARSAGIAVELRVEGEERELSETVEMCAYRVVQESLTNVVRHSGARSVAIVLGYGERTLTVAVEDDGGGEPGSPVRAGGGIEGMRERVALVGGTLEAGPRPGGGWSVCAELPLEARP